jgi:hypothetical protein
MFGLIEASPPIILLLNALAGNAPPLNDSAADGEIPTEPDPLILGISRKLSGLACADLIIF